MFIACGETKALSFARKSALFVQLPSHFDVVSLHSDMHANLDGGRNSGTKALFDESKVGTLVPRKFFLFILAFDDFVFIRYDECMTIFLYHVPGVL